MRRAKNDQINVEDGAVNMDTEKMNCSDVDRWSFANETRCVVPRHSLSTRRPQKSSLQFYSSGSGLTGRGVSI